MAPIIEIMSILWLQQSNEYVSWQHLTLKELKRYQLWLKLSCQLYGSHVAAPFLAAGLPPPRMKIFYWYLL